ncbi:MAG: hypothetical protein V9E89_02280 [Ilumatobacteraceae bacterium]
MLDCIDTLPQGAADQFAQPAGRRSAQHPCSAGRDDRGQSEPDPDDVANRRFTVTVCRGEQSPQLSSVHVDPLAAYANQRQLRRRGALQCSEVGLRQPLVAEGGLPPELHDVVETETRRGDGTGVGARLGANAEPFAVRPPRRHQYDHADVGERREAFRQQRHDLRVVEQSRARFGPVDQRGEAQEQPGRRVPTW